MLTLAGELPRTVMELMRHSDMRADNEDLH